MYILKKKNLIILGFCFLCVVIALVILFLLNNKENKEVLIKSTNEFELVKPEYIEDTYILNIDEDKVEYLKNNIVEAVNIIPTSDYTIKTNNQVLFALKEMYDNNNYSDLILRRGYLSDSDSVSAGVDDHKSGYDVDFFIKEKKWTDFEGNKSADDLLKNSYKYGFVLRYPNKDNYQPWHYRYVGKINAKIIHDENLTLFDYINKLNNLEVKQLYNVGGTDYVLYVVDKEDIVVPKYFNYEISSLNSNKYVIIFNTKKDVTISKLNEKNNIEEYDINQLDITYALALINKDNEIPNGLLNNINLVSLTKYLSEDNNPEYVLDETVLKKLQPIIEKANKLDRHTTYLTSSYRTYEEQKLLYDNGDKNLVQVPNHSEHQTGLAFDISNSYKPNTGFTETYQGMWFKQHANEYGFILRYPIDKVSITGISNEQWHFRYVGELNATIIKENNITLEEYMDYFDEDTIYEVSYNDKKYLFYKSSLVSNKIKTIKNNSNIYYLTSDTYLTIVEK